MNIIGATSGAQPTFSAEMDVKESDAQLETIRSLNGLKVRPQPKLDLGLPPELLAFCIHYSLYSDARKFEAVVHCDKSLDRDISKTAKSPFSLAETVRFVARHWNTKDSALCSNYVERYFRDLACEEDQTAFFDAMQVYKERFSNKESSEFDYLIFSSLPKDIKVLKAEEIGVPDKKTIQAISEKFLDIEVLHLRSSDCEASCYPLIAQSKMMQFVRTFCTTRWLREDELKAIAESPYWANLEEFQGSTGRLPSEDEWMAKVLKKSEQSLKKLEFQFLNVKSEEIISHMRQLQCLKLSGHIVSGIRIAQSELLGQLRELHLSHININDNFVFLLANNPAMGELTYLKITSSISKLTDAAVISLANSQFLTKIVTLMLNNLRELTDLGINALATSQTMKGLKVLHLGGSPVVTDASMVRLMHSDTVKNLEEIFLYGFPLLTEKTFCAIGESAQMQNLHTLNLNSFPSLSDRAIIAIGKKYLLKTIKLSGSTAITDASLEAIGKNQNMKDLEELILNRCSRITDRGIGFILTSPLIRKLRTLELTGTAVTEQGIRLMATSANLENLKHLAIDSVTDLAVKEIAESRYMYNLNSVYLVGSFSRAALTQILCSKHLYNLKDLTLTSSQALSAWELVRAYKGENPQPYLCHVNVM